jgi:DNA mismatch endonuclease, patch repair protein
MADVMTPKQRSRCMSRVKSKNTKPEMRLRKALWADGFRYRLQYKLPGKPDLVFVSGRLAVFVDGCFWHGCPDHATKPKTKEGFWATKLHENVERDRRVNWQLRGMGWNVLRVWQHDVEKDLAGVVQQVKDLLVNGSSRHA